MFLKYFKFYTFCTEMCFFENLIFFFIKEKKLVFYIKNCSISTFSPLFYINGKSFRDNFPEKCIIHKVLYDRFGMSSFKFNKKA